MVASRLSRTLVTAPALGCATLLCAVTQLRAELFDATYIASSGRFPDEGCIGWEGFGNENTQPAIVDDILVLTTIVDGDNQYYARSAPDIATPPVLNVEFRMKYVSGASATEGRTPAAFVATSDDFHDYRITSDTATGEVEVYYDGALVLQGSSFPDSQVTGPRMHRGDGSLYAHGESHWMFFRHNASTHVPINMVCGDPIADAAVGTVREVSVTTASDALLTLRASVGSACCELCVCDVDDTGAVTATDALTILRAAIGAGPLLVCPACP